MTTERYIPQNNDWVDSEDFNQLEVAQAVREQVGERFPIKFNGPQNAHVIIDFDALPDSVNETEVKQAVQDNHPHR